MISFDESDGSTTIQFPDGPVRIRPPRFGELRRLRAERNRLARAAVEQIAAWDAEHPEPEGDPVDPAVLVRYREDRVMAVEEINLESTVAWWRLILLGDDTFGKLSETPVPSDVDLWPAALLFDIRPLVPANSTIDVLMSAQSTPDRWIRHVGKVH